MPESSLELSGIVSRLERIERENCNLKRAAVVAVLITSAIFLMGQAKPNRTIEAEEFVLKDSTGKRLALLANTFGNGQLVLYGPQGAMASIGAGPNGSFVMLNTSARESAAVALALGGDNRP